MTEYLSPDEIAKEMFSKLVADDKKAIREDAPSAEHMLRYHHSVGRHIRNHYRLWDVENPHTKADAGPNDKGVIDDPLFPDQVSHAILTKVWEMVQKEAA